MYQPHGFIHVNLGGYLPQHKEESHPIDPVERHKHFVHIIQKGYPRDIDLKSKPVVIENDVWIGCNSVILSGVKIGQSAIVGAGAVVTKDVPSWTIVAGNPARIIRRITQSQDLAERARLELEKSRRNYIPSP